MKIFVIFLAFFFFQIESVRIECKFEEDEVFGYKCLVQRMIISSREDREITEISGTHVEGASNEDVLLLHAVRQNVNFFPLQLTNFFQI